MNNKYLVKTATGNKWLSLRHIIVCGIPYEFLKFLIRRNALEEYITERVKRIENHKRITSKHKKVALARTAPYRKKSLIEGTFTWAKSRKGWEYWKQLDELWRKECTQ